jgi:type IV secretion system protein VirB9
MKKIGISTAVLIFSFSAMTHAASIPRGMTSDKHIKMVQYDPNNVVLLKARYGYQTQITFSPSEKVQSVSIGDSLAWQAVPVSNNLFIKPIAESTTNMTVLTNTNSYNFELDSSNTKTVPTYKLQFRYLEDAYKPSINQNATSNFDPAKLNWKYSFTGDRTLAPIEAFDNGQFTYFKFKNDGTSRLPAFFTVDRENNEMLVNYHLQGDYVVINTVAKQFTLRDGVYVTSVYNDSNSDA